MTIDEGGVGRGPLQLRLAFTIERIVAVREMYDRGECPKEYMEDVTEACLRWIEGGIRAAETVDLVLTTSLLRGENALTVLKETK